MIKDYDSRFSLCITGLFCFLFIATTIRWTTTTVEILLFVILFIAYYFKKNQKHIFLTFTKNQKMFFYVVIFVLFSYLLTFILGKGWELESIKRPGYPSLSDLDIPTRYFLGIFVFCLLLRLNFKLNEKMIFYSVGIGGILNGLVALYERYILQISRVDGWVGIAEMGTASSLLCLFSLILFIFSTSKKEQIFFFISSLFASCAAFSTAARSAMISLVIAIFVFQVFLFIKKRKYLKKSMALLSSFLILLTLLWVFPVGEDTFRLKQIRSDIEQYQQDNPMTSIGLRFEMWKEAVVMFKMSPIYGMSTAMITKQTNEIIKKSGSTIRKPNDLGIRGKKHSQIMEALAKRGIVGLLALLLFWWTSLKMFANNLTIEKEKVLTYQLCGFLAIFYFIFINSFTGEPWDSMVDTPMILLICTLFAKLINQEKNENLSHHSC